MSRLLRTEALPHPARFAQAAGEHTGGSPSVSDRATRHLNQVELSRRWNISPRTLERWRWLHEGPQYLKVGGRVLYRLDDIESYEQAQLRAPSARDNG